MKQVISLFLSISTHSILILYLKQSILIETSQNWNAIYDTYNYRRLKPLEKLEPTSYIEIVET